jgi:hypothetical protein
MYGLVSKNIRTTIVKCTRFYREIYGLISQNVRMILIPKNAIIIWKYTDVFDNQMVSNYREMYG